MKSIPCHIIRGGTSKGIFIAAEDAPPTWEQREKLFLRIFGSPDTRQIDGLGGANSLTSKLAIVGKSARPDADVDYTFGQVSLDQPVIDWLGNCGNLSSAVGPFAIWQGLVKAVEPLTTVRIYNTNTKKLIIVEVPVAGGAVVETGDYAIPGVPGSAARVDVTFVEPAGSVFGKLLPTGKVQDVVTITDGRSFNVSLVDAGNPVVFLRAAELGLQGTELPVEVEKLDQVLATMEEVRGRIAQQLGMVDDWRDARKHNPAIPKVGFVSPARTYDNAAGGQTAAQEVDFVARLGSMQKMHRAYMVTGAICTAAAANLSGTVVHEMLSPGTDLKHLRIGQPYGPMDVKVTMPQAAAPEAGPQSVSVGRTARRILSGTAYYPDNLL